MIDDKKLQQFLGKMLIDLGAALSVPLVRIGVRLGLYKAMRPRSSAWFTVGAVLGFWGGAKVNWA